MDVRFISGRLCEPYEYFCNGCGTMNLSFVSTMTNHCRSCGSTDIICGAIGSLNKDKLKNEWRERAEKDGQP
jgi:DNA-directed RNA polymerase subunit RPC12/RpoP